MDLLCTDEYAGAGFGYVELGIVFEEMGRALLCAPYLASVALATEALLRCTDEAARKDPLPGLATGTTIGTLALLERPGRWDEASVRTRARPESGGWVLDGGKRHVLDGHTADLIMVGARRPAGVALFAVDGAAPGLRRVPVPTLDQTRKQAHLEFTGTPARLIGDEADGWRAASASPGSIPPTCTSSGPRRARRCSAPPATTETCSLRGSGWRSDPMDIEIRAEDRAFADEVRAAHDRRAGRGPHARGPGGHRQAVRLGPAPAAARAGHRTARRGRDR